MEVTGTIKKVGQKCEGFGCEECNGEGFKPLKQ